MTGITSRTLFTPRAAARIGFAALLLAGLSACTTGGYGSPGYGGGRGGGKWKRTPVLYPNEYYQSVGPEGAEGDIAGCMYRAEVGVGNKSAAGTVAANTAGGAALGAATGAIAGAITGRPGTGAAIGAAVGGTGGLARGAMQSRDNDPVFQGFVERCLRDKGYEVIGWK